MFDLPQKQLTTDTHNKTSDTDSVSLRQAALLVALDASVPRGLRGEVKLHLTRESVQQFLRREFPDGESIVVKGKKSGEVELKIVADVITVTLSPDVGALKRFTQKVLADQGKLAQLEAIAGDSIATLSGIRSSQSVGHQLVGQIIQDLTLWAQNDFKDVPGSVLHHLLSSKVSEPISAQQSLVKRVSIIGQVAAQSEIAEEFRSLQQRLERKTTRVARRIQTSEGQFDTSAIVEHGNHLGKIAMVSLSRYFSHRDEETLRFFSKEVVRVFELTSATFERVISNALRQGEVAPLKKLQEVACTFLNSWKEGGIFAALQVMEVVIDSPIKLRDKYESWYFQEASSLKDLIHAHNIIKDDVALPYSESLPIVTLLPILERVVPSISVPTAGGLRPFSEDVLQFGRELIAMARSSDPKVAEWYQFVTSGRRDNEDVAPNEPQQFDEDFPLYVLELLHEMCAWARSATPTQPFPKIQGGDNLYGQLLRSVMYNGALSLFAEMTEKERNLSTSTKECYYDHFEKLVGMLKTVDIDELQSTFLSLAKYFGKFEVLLQKAADASEAGELLLAKKLGESAVEVMIGCGKYFLGLPKAFQTDLEPETVAFLSKVLAPLKELDDSGELGRQLTAIETGVAMLDAVGSASELKQELQARLLRINNELIDACKHARKVQLSGPKERNEVSNLLNCVEAEIQKWEPLGAFPGSRSHCMDELRKSRRLMKNNRYSHPRTLSSSLRS